MLVALLAIPFIGALLCALLSPLRLSDRTPWVITLTSTVAGAAVLYLLASSFSAESPTAFMAPWVPQIGLNFSLWLDGPALFYATLIYGIGFFVFLYAGFYLDPKDAPWRFFGVMLFFMGSMLGVVLSKNVLLMLVFWELTSISSFLLIGHWHGSPSARQGAVRALIVTGGGGLCLMAGLAGLLWMQLSNGVAMEHALEWDTLWQHRAMIAVGGPGTGVLLLLLLGAFTKSAQFPFHFWLPGAMEAPTPVSAYLHAATMVKAGIYLLGRLYPIYWESETWLVVVGLAGLLTMLIGGYNALLAVDLKELLAHSTVSQLGLLTAYYGAGFGLVGSKSPLPMDLLLVASHALFKGSLFLLVGVIDHAVHTREWTRLGGLIKSMPVTAVLFIIGCLSMAGVPLLFGFVAKELFLKVMLHVTTDSPVIHYLFPALAIIGSAFTTAYCLRMIILPFFGKPRDAHIHAHEGGPGLLVSPAALMIPVVLAGVWVPLLEQPIGSLVRGEYYKTESGFHVAFFHHVDEVFWAAAAVFVLGAVIYLFNKRIEDWNRAMNGPAPFRSTYDRLFDGLIPGFAAGLTKLIQQPSLSRSAGLLMAVIFMLTSVVMMVGRVPLRMAYEVGSAEIIMGSMLILTAGCVWVVLTHRVLLFRLIALSPIGLFVAMIFLIYKAPDLGLTQLLVELAMLVVFLMLLWRLPQAVQDSAPAFGRTPAAAIALLAGTVVGVLSFVAFHSPFRDDPTFPGFPSAARFYMENTKYPAYATGAEAAAAGYPTNEIPHGGGGYNAVNVILVDFRGIDTMGEILVLGVAALGVLCLLTLGPRRGNLVHQRDGARLSIERIGEDFNETAEPGRHVLQVPVWGTPSLLLKELGRIAPALVLIFAVVLFWVGHNEPGGGFIAGLLVSVALILYYVSFAPRERGNIEAVPFLRFIPIGMFLAIGTGVAAVGLGHAFLRSAYVHLHLPVIGELGLSSVLAFDGGVFLIVVGMTMLIIKTFRSE